MYQASEYASLARIVQYDRPVGQFARWLELFEEAAKELFTPDRAAQFAAKAQNIARGLQMGMFYMPGAAPRAP